MAENNEFVCSDYIRYIDIGLQDIALKRKVNTSYSSIYILINFRRSKNKENTCDVALRNKIMYETKPLTCVWVEISNSIASGHDVPLPIHLSKLIYKSRSKVIHPKANTGPTTLVEVSGKTIHQ